MSIDVKLKVVKTVEYEYTRIIDIKEFLSAFDVPNDARVFFMATDGGIFQLGNEGELEINWEKKELVGE